MKELRKKNIDKNEDYKHEIKNLKNILKKYPYVIFSFI